MKTAPFVAFALALSVLASCEKDHGHPHPAPPTAGGGAPAPEGHGGHGKPMPLGEAVAGPFKLSVTRDESALKAGGEAAIDARVEAASAGGPKVAAVRFWIGAADGAGSLKAKADIEDSKDPTRWHTHAEIPDPFPATARLYVEIEDSSAARHVASFDLKR